jgi:hypothetical protein
MQYLISVFFKGFFDLPGVERVEPEYYVAFLRAAAIYGDV